MNEKKKITFILYRSFPLLIQSFYQRAQNDSLSYLSCRNAAIHISDDQLGLRALSPEEDYSEIK